MLIEFFKKRKLSKWLSWVWPALFILIPMIMILGGEVSRGVGTLLVFASILLGIILGDNLALIISTRILKTSEDMKERLRAAFSVFGFLFLPMFAHSFTSSYLGTAEKIDLSGTWFLWTCIAAGIAFCISPERSKDGT